MQLMATLLLSIFLFTGCVSRLADLQLHDSDSGSTVASKVAQRAAWCALSAIWLCASEWMLIPMDAQQRDRELSAQRSAPSVAPLTPTDALLLHGWLLGGYGPGIHQPASFYQPWPVTPVAPLTPVIRAPVLCTSQSIGGTTSINCY